ncbi:MAG TPA: exodeoxyribonuclease VII large subunit [Verrucomicrobiales bacterium]|nr:exodeoxyribonuclease VII large subunit [Verrucomicrobiales bacterium]
MDLFPPSPQASGAGTDAEKILTVSQVTRQVKDVLESRVGSVWVQGEISNYRRQTSGHHYFKLKDAGAQLSCVLFKGSAQFVRAPLADGLMVQVFGGITVYEARGQYQMLVKKVQAAGQGALQAKFEELKRRLAAEGLFETEEKQSIPRFPRTVAIVTSPTGAALQDMLNILARRAPYLRVLIAPVRVQGIGAEHEIAAALRLLEAESGRSLPPIDTVVLARGGGSLEDLWCFNEEVVARAIFACPLPVISAVGHEIDFTIADFTADLRAPTPSAAAELLAPDSAELLAMLTQQGLRMQRRVQQALETARRVLDLTGRAAVLRDAERLLLPWRQHVDGLEDSLKDLTAGALQERAATVQQWQHRLELKRPDRVLAERTATLRMLRERLHSRAAAAMERLRAALDQKAGLLRTLGPEATLERGFTCTLDAAGRVVREASQLQPGQEFETRFRKGRVRGTVREVTED